MSGSASLRLLMMDRLGIRESIYTKIIINAQALVAKYRCVVIGGLLFVGLGIHKIFVLNRRSGREMHSSQPLMVLALHTLTTIPL